MRRALLFLFCAWFTLPALACSCGTNEAFLKVADKAPRIVLGKVMMHEGKSRAGGPLLMQVQVLEIWKGQPGQPTLRVQGGDGWLCRPEVSEFPVGSTWLLALNGPGSKPGMDQNFALSNCGQYWLRVTNGKAQGRIHSDNREEVLPLAELKTRLQQLAQAQTLALQGEVKAGQLFQQEFARGLIFKLQPGAGGWEILVHQKNREENLARLTPPLHFAPNPRFIEPAHFFAPEKARAAANAPGKEREFIFSPAVGNRIAGAQATRPPTAEDIETIRRQGRGKLTILEIRGNAGRIDFLRFTLELAWRPMPSEMAAEQPGRQ